MDKIQVNNSALKILLKGPTGKDESGNAIYKLPEVTIEDCVSAVPMKAYIRTVTSKDVNDREKTELIRERRRQILMSISNSLLAANQLVNCSKKLNVQQIQFTAEQILDKFGLESVEDVVMAIKNGAAGDYGDIIRLEPATVFKWIRAHLQSKYEVIESNIGKKKDHVNEIVGSSPILNTLKKAVHEARLKKIHEQKIKSESISRTSDQDLYNQLKKNAFRMRKKELIDMLHQLTNNSFDGFKREVRVITKELNRRRYGKNNNRD